MHGSLHGTMARLFKCVCDCNPSYVFSNRKKIMRLEGLNTKIHGKEKLGVLQFHFSYKNKAKSKIIESRDRFIYKK